MTFDGGILLESWTVARLSAKTVLSQELSSHIAGALETLAPQLVMTSNLEKAGGGPIPGLERSLVSLKLSIALQEMA